MTYLYVDIEGECIKIDAHSMSEAKTLIMQQYVLDGKSMEFCVTECVGDM